MSPFDLGWVVGILEGEGCFTWCHPAPGRTYPQIAVAMSDEDTIFRLALILGTKYHKRPEPRDNRKQCWRVQITGRKAVELMRQVRPYMSARRKARIDELLASL